MRALGRRLAVLALSLAVVAAAAVLVAGPGYRFGGWGLGGAFLLLRWGAMLGLAAAALGTLATVVALAQRARRGGVIGIITLVVGLAAFGIPWRMQQQAHRVPPIHDITTDTDDPPAFVAVLPLRKNAPNPAQYAGAELAAQQKQGYPELAPLVLPVPPRAAFELALDTARRSGWEIVAAVPEDNRIEATATTDWFGFKDDIVIRIKPAGTGSRVDMRSVSRVGHSDLGTNARRIRDFLRQLSAGKAG